MIRSGKGKGNFTPLKKKHDSIHATASISTATLCSRVLGLVREQVFAYFFGASIWTDAYQIASRIPQLLRELFAEGSMSSALVPAYVEVKRQGGEKKAWELIHKLISVLGISLLALVVLCIYFSEAIVSIFPIEKDSEQFLLTVRLTQIMMPFILTVTLAAIWMSVLNARNRYFIPALAPAFYNLIFIFSAFAFIPVMPRLGFPPIYAMALGFLFGGITQWVTQVPSLRKEGFRFRFNGQWKDPQLKKILFVMFLGALGMIPLQANILVTSYLALSQGEGVVSWLNYAFRLLQFPIGVFAVALSQITLTRISQNISLKNNPEAVKTIESSLRASFFLSLPSTVGLAVLGYPIVSIIFERGNFSSTDTQLTYEALCFYVVGLVGYSFNKVATPVLYATNRAPTAVLLSALSIFSNIALCLMLLPIVGFVGLALATSLSAYIHMASLGITIHRQLRGIPWGSLAKGFFQYAIASLGMGLCLYFYWRYFALEWEKGSFFSHFVILSCGILLGTLAYWLITRAQGSPEMLSIEKRLVQYGKRLVKK